MSLLPNLLSIGESVLGVSSGSTGGNPTQVYTATTPGGPVTYAYTGTASGFTTSAGPVFDSWAKAGHFDWLAQIAGTGTGPKWTDPSVSQQYGPIERAYAGALLAGYGKSTAATATTTAPPTASSPSPLQQAIDTVLGTAEQQGGALLTGAGIKATAAGSATVQQNTLVPQLSPTEIVVGVVLLLAVVVVIVKVAT